MREMALSPHILQFPMLHSLQSLQPHYLLFYHSPPLSAAHKATFPVVPIAVSVAFRGRCLTKSAEEDRWGDPDVLLSEAEVEAREDAKKVVRISSSNGDSVSLGIREPVYEVVEVRSNGMVSTRKINRRQLLKSSGLRPRDIRSVDPSLFLTNSMPTLLVRENAILLNLGSLRAIAMREHVLIFDYNRKGGKAFIDTLLPRLNLGNINGGPCMPFELEPPQRVVTIAPP